MYLFVGLCSTLEWLRNELNHVQNGAKMNEISMLKVWCLKLEMLKYVGKWHLVPHRMRDET